MISSTLRVVFVNLCVVIVNLMGCTATLPPVPKVVSVPISVPCIDRADVPTATFISDAELAKLDDGPCVIQLARDRLDRIGHIGRLEATIQACIK